MLTAKVWMVMVLSVGPAGFGDEYTETSPTDLMFQTVEECEKSAEEFLAELVKNPVITAPVTVLATTCQPAYAAIHDKGKE
jgi:hypothetical protein